MKIVYEKKSIEDSAWPIPVRSKIVLTIKKVYYEENDDADLLAAMNEIGQGYEMWDDKNRVFSRRLVEYIDLLDIVNYFEKK